MKQEHFMQTLRNELRNLPKNEVDEIVADYREYIADAIAAGRNEEEVIAALGDPLKLARELKAQANFRQWENHRSLSNLMRVVISIAGLGVMNTLLFFPFLVYMMMLSVGYILSISLAIAGVAMVIGAGGNRIFNWPLIPSMFGPNVFFESSSKHEGGSHSHSGHFKLDDGRGSSSIPEVRQNDGRFTIKLDDGEEAKLVMSNATPVVLESDDGKISVDTDNPVVAKMVVENPDGSVSVARKDVLAMTIENDQGESFSYAAGADGGGVRWHAHSSDGDVDVTQSAQAGHGHVAVNNDQNSLEIDSNHVRIHSEDGDDISIGGFSGMSLISTVVLFGIGFMIAGVLGLWLCIWISRLTWRGLARYVKYQISVVTGKEPLNTIG